MTKSPLSLAIWSCAGVHATVGLMGVAMLSALAAALDSKQHLMLLELLTGAIVVGIGGWAIRSFLRFKEEALARADEDRAAATSHINRVRDELATKADLIAATARADKTELLLELNKTTLQLERLHIAITGLDGKGGILEEVREMRNTMKDLFTERTQ